MDTEILFFIREHIANPVLDFLMPIISMTGNAGIIWIALAILLIFTKKYRSTGITLGMGLVFCLVFCNILLKNIVQRIRPYDVHIEIELLIEKLHDFSFPSGHTTASFCAVAVLFCYKNKLRWYAFTLAVLIAFSRLYLFVHYPTDVLAGVILGSFLGVFAYQITKRIDYFKDRAKNGLA